jgi:hypothetical protein
MSDVQSSRAAERLDRAKCRQIMEGARAVFLAQGFDGASMGEIAVGAIHKWHWFCKVEMTPGGWGVGSGAAGMIAEPIRCLNCGVQRRLWYALHGGAICQATATRQARSRRRRGPEGPGFTGRWRRATIRHAMRRRPEHESLYQPITRHPVLNR